MDENAYRLQTQSGSQPGREYELSTASLTVGRYPLADIVIDDPDVSYRHAILTRAGETYRIADLGSDSGTYVNGQRIGPEPVVLAHGDIILLGSRFSAAFLAHPIEISAMDDAIVEGLPVVEPASAAPPALDQPAGDLAPTALEAEIDSTSGNEYDPPLWEAAAEAVNSASSPVEIAPAPVAEKIGAGHAGPLPAMPPAQKKKNGRIMLITAGCLVALLACCCSSTLFMYFIGGDWLLNQLGYLP